ncbi:MAG: hypothetical protein WD691_03525 [Acidimicrobiales bacterium]
MHLELDPVERRVMGSQLEEERTVPDTLRTDLASAQSEITRLT